MSIFCKAQLSATFLTLLYLPLFSTNQRIELSSKQKTPLEKNSIRRRFVIHEHNATHLHYDLRLEYNRTLKSWALPKKPSMKHGVKRLAIPQPDHKLSYISFEGTLPKGSYGAGSVKIWDSGTYFSIKQKNGKHVPFGKTLADGHIEIWIEGEKLHGAFALIKAHFHDKDEWLFMKIDDDIYLHSKE